MPEGCLNFTCLWTSAARRTELYIGFSRRSSSLFSSDVVLQRLLENNSLDYLCIVEASWSITGYNSIILKFRKYDMNKWSIHTGRIIICPLSMTMFECFFQLFVLVDLYIYVITLGTNNLQKSLSFNEKGRVNPSKWGPNSKPWQQLARTLPWS